MKLGFQVGIKLLVGATTTSQAALQKRIEPSFFFVPPGMGHALQSCKSCFKELRRGAVICVSSCWTQMDMVFICLVLGCLRTHDHR